jgi:uncharacterized damage-inducible protein DinB
MHRPDPGEYGEYYHRYASLVPDGDIIATLSEQFPVTRRLLESVPADREEWAYDEGKWSVREVVGHLADAERVFADRALWMARDPGPPLPGMDQEVWAASSNARTRPLRQLLEEWAAVREATIALLRGLDTEALSRTGTASGNRFTVRSFAWIIAGHELHHRRILEERYGLKQG